MRTGAPRKYPIRAIAFPGSVLLWVSIAGFTQTVDEGAHASPSLEEIIITAQRRTENLENVAMSVSAFTRAKLDAQAIKSVDDIARLTPGLLFYRTDLDSFIAIRGIESTAGTPTTGIYIDDTPVQVGSNAYPATFDLERTEVLRGPQGTLFGAGSEGGAVRFISTPPSLQKYSGTVRTEMGFTQGGSPSYESGIAAGGPIAENRVGFRVSAWFRHDGGFVDRVSFPTGGGLDSNSNWQDTKSVRGALTFAPSGNPTITPSVFYQRQYLHDTNFFWMPSSEAVAEGGGNQPLTDPAHRVYQNGARQRQPSSDEFTLPALQIEFHAGSMRLLSSTSYYDRKTAHLGDLTNFTSARWTFDETTGHPAFSIPADPSWLSTLTAASRYRFFTQELRLQSTDAAARFTWVAGLFFSEGTQIAVTTTENNFLSTLIPELYGVSFDQFFGGAGLAQGRYMYFERLESHQRQLAGFGQFDFNLSRRLKLTAGLRVARDKFHFVDDVDGPVNRGFSRETGNQADTPVTPKFVVSFTSRGGNLFYASAAAGYRGGGANAGSGGLPCAEPLAAIGLTRVPASFNSDSVWSYEVGTKSTLLERRLQVNGSAFYIDWEGIQQDVQVSCGLSFTANLGKAHTQGADLEVQARVARRLLLNASLGYVEGKFDATIPGLVHRGDSFALWPWTAALSAEYDFITRDRREVYVRLDGTYLQGPAGRPAYRNPLNPAYYDPDLGLEPSTRLLNLRAGMKWSGFDVSVALDNALNANPILSRGHARGGDQLFTAQTFRPRTLEMSAAYRF
jgi:iron complex outermembrane recepter protein